MLFKTKLPPPCSTSKSLPPSPSIVSPPRPPVIISSALEPVIISAPAPPSMFVLWLNAAALIMLSPSPPTKIAASIFIKVSAASLPIVSALSVKVKLASWLSETVSTPPDPPSILSTPNPPVSVSSKTVPVKTSSPPRPSSTT